MSSAVDKTVEFLEKRDGIDKVRAFLARNEPLCLGTLTWPKSLHAAAGIEGHKIYIKTTYSSRCFRWFSSLEAQGH
jgi:hypothetical protein